MYIKCFLVLIGMVLSSNISFTQETDSLVGPRISSIYIPINCLDSAFYIEKLEEVSYHEVAVIIGEQKFKSEKKIAADVIEYHNSVAVVKYNQSFEKIAANETKINISTFYKGDHEKLPKYSVVSKYNYTPYRIGHDDIMYAIYDNEKKVRYAYFNSLEVLFAAIRASKTYMHESSSRDQDDLDAYLEKKVSRLERKARPRDSGAGTFWLIFAGVLSAVVLVANLVTL